MEKESSLLSKITRVSHVYSCNISMCLKVGDCKRNDFCLPSRNIEDAGLTASAKKSIPTISLSYVHPPSGFVTSGGR